MISWPIAVYLERIFKSFEQMLETVQLLYRTLLASKISFQHIEEMLSKIHRGESEIEDKG